MQYKKEQFKKDSAKVKGNVFTVPNEYTSIQIGCFENAIFKEIVLPPNIKTIPRECFYKSEIERIIIPDSVEAINDVAFANCKKLKDITFSKNLISIGDLAFHDTESLYYLTLPDSLKEIGSQCFLSSSVREITFGKELTHLGTQAFSNCKNIETLNLRDTKIEYFGVEIFLYCNNLKYVYLPENFYFHRSYENLFFVNLFEKLNVKKIYKSDNTELPEKILNSMGIKIINYSKMNLDDLIESNKSFKEINTVFKNLEK